MVVSGRRTSLGKMSPIHPKIRVVTRTVSAQGAVSFNQVVMLQETDQPVGVLLAAWDQEAGVYVWLRGQADVEAHATSQHGGYSLSVGQFSLKSPPAWLGHPIFLPKDMFDPWENVEEPQDECETCRDREGAQFGPIAHRPNLTGPGLGQRTSDASFV